MRNIRTMWAELVQQAVSVDRSLEVVKSKFTRVTQGEVSTFVDEVRKLREEFAGQGPASDRVSLDRGVELTTQYLAQLQAFNKRRDDLVLAEKLFNLNITSYPELVEMEADLQQLAGMYELYTQFKEMKQRWSEMLWSDLDVNALTTGMANLTGKLKKGSRKWKTYGTYKMVESEIAAFQESIPLLQNLKNDALRERHWKKLMEATGKTFEMNPKTFTLDNLFSMELHKFSQVIEEITTYVCVVPSCCVHVVSAMACDVRECVCLYGT